MESLSIFKKFEHRAPVSLGGSRALLRAAAHTDVMVCLNVHGRG
jgi:hypothetical protein